MKRELICLVTVAMCLNLAVADDLSADDEFLTAHCKGCHSGSDAEAVTRSW